MTLQSAILVPRRAWAAPLLAAVLWIAPAPAARAAQAPSLTPAEWREDLRVAMQKIRDVHPSLYRRVKADSLEAAARTLDRIIPELNDDQVTVGLMQLVSKIQDGQTLIVPWRSKVAGGWFFPLRFQRFSDGLFITEAPKDRADLAGAKVIRIGTAPAEEAFDRISGLLSYDNAFTRLYRGTLALVTPSILHGAGLTRERDTLEVTVRTRQGAQRTERIPAVADESGEWLWKDAGLPVAESVSVTDRISEFPVTKPRDRAYWYAYFPDRKVFYVQFNAVKNERDDPFDHFCDRMWHAVDSLDVEKFILDVRRNDGGMSRILNPLLHGVIRRDSINRTGRFLMLTGRRTSGAAVDCQAFFEAHTNVLFVGEPSGASPNHADEPVRYVLPQSGLALRVSKYLWTTAEPWDKRPAIQPQIPVTVSSADYFDGRDPVYEAAATLQDYKSLTDLLREAAPAGLAKARAAYRDFRKRYPEEFGETSEREINYIGYTLMSEGSVDPAIVLFRLNAELFPQSWNVWDSLGEGLMEKGDTAGAIANYEKSVKMNPDNTGGKSMLRTLRSQGGETGGTAEAK